MANPLDRFISVNRGKFDIKVPPVPKTGIPKVDASNEQWRRGLEQMLERIMQSIAQPTTTVTPATPRPIPGPPPVIPPSAPPVIPPVEPDKDKDGSRWFYVTAVPTAGLGEDDDWAIDGSTGNVYQRVSSVWTLRYSLGPQRYVGTTPLTQDAKGGAVTGLGLPFTPTKCGILGITRPANGKNIEAYPVSGSISADGFTYELSARPTDGNMVLVYELTT